MTLPSILAILLGVAGIVGSIVPGLPGPPLSWLGLLVMYLRHGTDKAGDPMTTTLLFVMLAVTVAVTVLDYVVPAWFTRATGGSRYAGIGSVVGLFAGLVFPLPGGMIAGSLLGAFLFELIFADKSAGMSLKAALGAFLGFLLGTGIKLAASAVMMYYIVVYI